MSARKASSVLVRRISESCEVWCISQIVDIDGRLSWRTPRAEGQRELINSYVICNSTHAVLVETGVTEGVDAQMEAIDRVLAGRRLTSVLATRFEPDCLSNLGAIVRRYRPDRVYAGGGLSPLDFFDELSMTSHVGPVAAPAEVVPMRPAEKFELLDGLIATIRRPVLQVLGTVWLRLEDHGVLFTSDSFSHLPYLAPGSAADNVDRYESLDLLRDHYSRRCEWLHNLADPSPVVDDLREAFSEAVLVTAPSRGEPILGERNVRRSQLRLVEAIASFGATS
ncbi:MAG: hypothetical protein EKK42_09435 [Pseudonocardiaceae bacterium]|nr:MAG: hypothetical protein EKK42_09435 [Pseudonocardiaceae bacterium]